MCPHTRKPWISKTVLWVETRNNQRYIKSPYFLDRKCWHNKTYQFLPCRTTNLQTHKMERRCVKLCSIQKVQQLICKWCTCESISNQQTETACSRMVKLCSFHLSPGNIVLASKRSHLRPRYTMAKGSDHKIMRALATHPKAIPWNIEIILCVVTGFKCSRNTYVTGLSTKCYIIPSYSCEPFQTMSYDELRIVRFWSVMVAHFCIRSTSLRDGVDA